MQIFPRKLNLLPVVLAAGAFAAGGAITFVFWYYFSPKNLQVGYAPEQPVPYSHRLHAGELGMDCRYCHSSVEVSQEAVVPPTQTCMGCHSHVKKDSPRLTAVRKSWETGQPVEWVRVHKLPEHSYFNHSVHVNSGVGCTSCHGRIDQMEVVSVAEPIAMQWCLDCHRNPAPHLRPPEEVTNMDWDQESLPKQELAALVESVNPPTHCSGCHR